MLRRSLLPAALACASCSTLLAQGQPQDLIGANFAGNAAVLHSVSGAGFTLGATGRAGHNGMARLGDDLFTTEQVGVGLAAQFFLNRLDDDTGAATRSVSLSRDLRALAPGGTFSLAAIAESSGNDQFVVVSTLSGAITVVGSTGFAALQGLTLAGNIFYGWDLSAGLVRIDHLTGQATDVNPSVGTNGAGIQFLCTTPDGRVLGGQNSIYRIDLATGIPSLLGSGAYNDLRGAEVRFGVAYTFGESCGGITQTISGSARAGGTISTACTGLGSFGASTLMIGFSETSFQGLPIPLNLSSLLGTTGCLLLAGPEITIPLRANRFGVATLDLPIPGLSEGLIVRLQHVSFSVPGGGFGFSNGAEVRVEL